MLASVEFEAFVAAEALYLRASAAASTSTPVAVAAPVALAAASASSAPPVLWAMFGNRLFDQRELGARPQTLIDLKTMEDVKAVIHKT